MPPREFDNGNLPPVKVQISEVIYQILELDQKSEVLSTITSTQIMWTDKRLAWNANKYSSISTMEIPARRIWLPGIHLGNAAGSSYGRVVKSSSKLSEKIVILRVNGAKRFHILPNSHGLKVLLVVNISTTLVFRTLPSMQMQ